MLGNESESNYSVEYSDVGLPCLPIPNIDHPSISKELDIILSDGELDLDVELEDDILKDL